MIDLRLKRLRRVFREYPAPFRTLVVASFIDRLGGALLFPFLTLYITRKFDVGMTEVGIIFALFSLASVGGSFLGGALADKLGRKGMIIFGLVFSALTNVLMGLLNRIELFYL
ncbi:MAG: MFS transporter, partial [Anaerolineae bacterium]